MPYGAGAFEFRDDRAVEDVGYQSHPAMRDQRLAVGRDDSRRLLSAMLLRVETQVREVGSLGVPIHAEYSAFLVEDVELRFFDCYDRVFFSHRL